MAPNAFEIVGLVLGLLALLGIQLRFNLIKRFWEILAGRIPRRRNGARDEEGLPMTSADTQGSRSSAPSQSGNAPNNGHLPITTEQRGSLRPSTVRATAVSSYPAPSARNRHHPQTTSMSPGPQQPLDRASSDSPSTRLPRTVTTTTASTSSGTSAAAEAPQSDRQRQRAHDSQLQPLEDTTTEGETQLAESSPEIHDVSPGKGPITGGEPIFIIGAGFPSMLLYVRFGDNFAFATLRNQTTLQCTLPSASCPGVVSVTLSRAPDRNAPQFGQSFTKFRYEDSRIEALLYLLKIVYEKANRGPLENFIALARQYLQGITSTLLSQGGINTQVTENYNVLKVEELEEISIQFLSYYCKTEEGRNTISSCNKHGQTLAHISAMLGYLNLLRHLVAWGIDLNITDLQGSTALHYAFLCNKTECATLLILSGVDEHTLDKLGRSPWALNPSLADEVTSGLRGMSRIDDGFSESSHSMDNGCETERPEEASAHRAKYLLVEMWLKQMKEDRHSTDSLSSDPGSAFRTSPAHLSANLGHENDLTLVYYSTDSDLATKNLRIAAAHPIQWKGTVPKVPVDPHDESVSQFSHGISSSYRERDETSSTSFLGSAGATPPTDKMFVTDLRKPSSPIGPSFPTASPRSAFQMDCSMTDQMRSDLDELKCLFQAASWRPRGEPIVGNPDCPVLAEQYTDRGNSCYAVFVYRRQDGLYGCRHERCFLDGSDRGPSFRSTKEGIVHQRKYHF